MFDKKSSGSKDTYGIIKLNDRILNIYADENQNAYIKDAKLDTDIASWKQVGDYAEVRAGKDSFFQEHTLLCIAIFIFLLIIMLDVKSMVIVRTTYNIK